MTAAQDQAAPSVRREGGRERSGEAPLVSTSISQQNTLEIYRQALYVKRPGTGNQNAQPPDRTAKNLEGFSYKSRARLRFLAENSESPLISQFGLTYHNQWPTDGRIAKQHLNAWLTNLRRLIPGVGYLWLLEFQKRNTPHFHIFLTVSPDPVLWQKLADAWCRLTQPGDDDQLWWHGPKRGKNWIPWKMASAGYLCKYLDKESQKAIPDGYSFFGRFWGNSRNLKPTPRTIPISDLENLSQVDYSTGEIYGGESTVIRWLGNLAEKQTRGFSRFRSRASWGSYSMRRGAPAFLQIEKYFSRLPVKGSPF